MDRLTIKKAKARSLILHIIFLFMLPVTYFIYVFVAVYIPMLIPLVMKLVNKRITKKHKLQL